MTCPLPEEEDAPFATPPQTLEVLTAALSGIKEMKATDIPLSPPDEKMLAGNTTLKKRRSAAGGGEGEVVTAPMTPTVTKAEEPSTGGPAKRASRRRR